MQKQDRNRTLIEQNTGISISDNVLEGVFVGVHSFSKPRGKHL